MDQRLFILARESALKDLLASDPSRLPAIKTHIGYATTSMILGWATGGIIFGMMSDRIGRVKTMVATLLVYSGFTGLVGIRPDVGGFHDLSLSRRPRRRRDVRRGDHARGRKRAGTLSRDGARLAAGAVRDGEHHRLAHQPADSAGRRTTSSAASPAGASSFSSAFCRRC